MWGYKPKAEQLRAALVKAIGQDKLEFNLFGGRRSSFEISIGTEEVFSKLSSGKWPLSADIIALVQDRLNGKTGETKTASKAGGSCADGSCSTGACAADNSTGKCDTNPAPAVFKTGETKAKGSTTISIVLISFALLALVGGYLAKGQI